MRRDDRWAWGLRGDGRIDPRDPHLAALALITGCLVLALLALGAAPVSAAIRVTGPAEVRIGQEARFRVQNLPAHEHVTVSLAPTRHRGGNCCGIDADEGHADRRGTALLRFRWPSHYRNGDERVRWRHGSRADVIVVGDAGRAIRVVRVRRPIPAPRAAGALSGFRVNRAMAGVALGDTPAAVRESLGAPARTDAGPDFAAWTYDRPPIEVTFKPAVVTLHTTSDEVRGPRSIGVGTSERRLRAVLGRRLRCRAAQGLCMVGSFATGRRSTVFDMKRRRVAAVTISVSTR